MDLALEKLPPLPAFFPNRTMMMIGRPS